MAVQEVLGESRENSKTGLSFSDWFLSCIDCQGLRAGYQEFTSVQNVAIL